MRQENAFKFVMSITTLRLDSFIGKKTYSLFDNSYLLALTCIDSLFFLPMKESNLKVVILPVRKRPAGIQVNLNTWNLKKILVDFFFPHMRWNTGGKLYKVTK